MLTHLPTCLFYLLVSTASEIYFYPLFNSHLEVGHQTSLQRDKKKHSHCLKLCWQELFLLYPDIK